MHSPSSIVHKRIAYACLDWGLGHLTRSVDILSELIENKNDVMFCGTLRQIEYMRGYFPEISVFILEYEGVFFKGDNHFFKEGIRNARRLRRLTRKVKQSVEIIHENFNPDFFISDHFYPFFRKNTPSIFVTHQYHLPPKTPWLVRKIHQNWMLHFQNIWLVDDEQLNLAGSMTRNCKEAIYIGIRSRFRILKQVNLTKSGGVVCLLSGPEIYAKQLLNLLPDSAKSRITLLSPYDLSSKEIEGFNTVIRNREEADQCLMEADIIICRSGYSTLMDLVVLGKKEVILIPTRGQFEQEYLAELHKGEWSGESCDLLEI